MGRLAGVTHALLRVVAGLLFLCHGGQKLLGWFGGIGMPPGTPLPPLMMTAGTIELVGGSLILIGLLTRPVAFIASGEMAFAYFMSHFPHGFWPLQNHGESPVLFCFIFLFFAFNGAGPASVDAAIRRSRSSARATASV